MEDYYYFFDVLRILFRRHASVSSTFVDGKSTFIIKKKFVLLLTILKEYSVSVRIDEGEVWMLKYNENIFFKLFRMTTTTFKVFLEQILQEDEFHLLKKKYRGGRFPVSVEKSLLIYLAYIATQETLQCLSDRFEVSVAAAMRIVNVCLYLTLKLKKKYIYWPANGSEFNTIISEFRTYPGCVGAVDGSHIDIKVPKKQRGSYTNRYMSQSINLMTISTAKNIFTYIFVGFPGSAHDSRVFTNSSFVRNLETIGRKYAFISDDHHIIGDSAFPLKDWCLTPYKGRNLNPQVIYHNICLSKARVCIEHTFGLLKGRWRRLLYVNVYNIAKAVEITSAACILHNFCYKHGDIWDEPIYDKRIETFMNPTIEKKGKEKREKIKSFLFNQTLC